MALEMWWDETACMSAFGAGLRPSPKSLTEGLRNMPETFGRPSDTVRRDGEAARQRDGQTNVTSCCLAVSPPCCLAVIANGAATP